MMSLALQTTLIFGILKIISAQQGQSDSSFCVHISSDKCSNADVKKLCPNRCASPARECGSFAAVSHLGGGAVHGGGNIDYFSPLVDNGGTASLHTSATDLGFGTHRCGATLISDRYLLTAAHCLDGSERLVSISLGREDLNINPSPGPDTYLIQDVFFHPEYESTKHDYNDLAVIKTERKVQFSDNVWPFCLPDTNQVFTNYLLVNIAGWGHVNQSHKSSSIKTAFVHLIGKSACESSWRQHASDLYDVIRLVTYPQGLTNQILCGGRDGVDACEGDSGGPMSYQNSDGLRMLVGLIAKRTDCPDYPITPGFYTNVAHYVDWIYAITGLPNPSAPKVPQSSPPPPPTVPEPVVSMTAAERKAIFPSESECGISLSNNVVAGEKTSPGEWPWLAAIGAKINADFIPFCGGTLITKQHVISAAHCFPGTRRFEPIVRLGEYNVNIKNSEDKALDFIIVDRRAGAYDNGKRKNDIILLKLDRPLNSFTDSIRAACLPYHLRNDNLEGNNLIVVGWGRFDNNLNATSIVPLKGGVSVVPIRECQERIKKTGYKIDDKQLCAGTGGTDTCKGDSGGPINYLDINKQRFYVVGIVSFGPTLCGSNQLPGIYTRIGYYLDWIEENIKQML